MPISVTMPRLSDTMEAGTIVRWNVKEGDEVTSGQVVADIETDKATMEMPVFDDGRIARLLVPAGQSVKVGTQIAVIAEEGESLESAAKGGGSAAPVAAKAVAAAPSAPVASAAPSHAAPASRDEDSVTVGGQRVRVSPVARRMAEEHGIPLGSLQGSGPGGRIIKRDVMTAMENTASRPGAPVVAAPAATAQSLAVPVASASRPSGGLVIAGLESERVSVSGMRQTIARRLVESKTTIPHYQVSMKFDLDRLMAVREQLNTELASTGIKLSVNDFIVRGCALAMARHPYVNSSWAGDAIAMHKQVNVGVAVALDESKGGGLVVAVIRDADRKSLRAISAESKALGEKARTRGLSAEDMADSTQPRHVRRGALHGDHQPAQQRHPGLRRGHQAAGGSQRRADGRLRDDRHAVERSPRDRRRHGGALAEGTEGPAREPGHAARVTGLVCAGRRA
ncbi:MAG: 2-oxo acid dehydrogenase subunit E2 [Planctomycetaceae bacterium]|nr:2-oxo acid dehydrogenase subunit E2 [Planctomycetaceae bacterium]